MQLWWHGEAVDVSLVNLHETSVLGRPPIGRDKLILGGVEITIIIVTISVVQGCVHFFIMLVDVLMNCCCSSSFLSWTPEYSPNPLWKLKPEKVWSPMCSGSPSELVCIEGTWGFLMALRSDQWRKGLDGFLTPPIVITERPWGPLYW